jgi:hypothetical protein
LFAHSDLSWRSELFPTELQEPDVVRFSARVPTGFTFPFAAARVDSDLLRPEVGDGDAARKPAHGLHWQNGVTVNSWIWTGARPADLA